MYREIDSMKAEEAAVAASLMSGTVRPSAMSWLRNLLGFLLLFLMLFLFVRLIAVLSLHWLLLLLAVTVKALRDATNRLGESVTFDGETGMIVWRRALRKPLEFHVSEVTSITRTSEQDGENDARWVGRGRNMRLQVTVAHFSDWLFLEVYGNRCFVLLRKSDFGRRSKGYDGGDEGAEAFDRYIRLYERSLRPDPPDEDGLFDRRMAFQPNHHESVEMPTL